MIIRFRDDGDVFGAHDLSLTVLSLPPLRLESVPPPQPDHVRDFRPFCVVIVPVGEAIFNVAGIHL